MDVITAITTQNLVLPSGTVKMGSTEYNVEMNGSPDTLAALNNIPIKTANGATIYVRDVAYVSDGFSPQINIVRMDGQRGVILAIYKTGDTSTLDVVSQIYSKLPHNQEPRAAANSDHAALRSIDFRAGRHSGSDSRRSGRRLPHRADDPAVPGKLAQHADHRHLDSAFDSGLHHGAERAARNDQSHDARRPGARRRHPGGRRHGGDRKYRAKPRAGQGHDPRDSGRLAGNRHSGAGLDAVHLHRVRAHVFPDGRGEIPVRAAGRSRRFRHARFLRAVANARADHGHVSAQGAPRRGIRHRQRYFLARAARIRARLRPHARRLPRFAGLLPGARLAVCDSLSCVLRGVDVPGSRAGPGLLSRAWMPD